MTSASLLRRSGAPGDVLGGVATDLADDARSLTARAADRLRADDGRAQFARFVLVGGLSSAVYAVLFVLLDGVGDQPANIAGSVLSSMVANELHRRLTFRAGDRVGWWAAQWQGGGVALVGIVATSLALAWLDGVTGATGVVADLTLVALVTGAIGLARFVALRWLFGARGRRA